MQPNEDLNTTPDAERLAREHPARAEQVDESFATGSADESRSPDQMRESNFARGNSGEAVPGTERKGRFSEGEELEPPGAPGTAVEGRFSEGEDRSPTRS